ncbi:MAG: nucleotidyltransferase family protein [Clostridia bacterium]|nr:nucleotidyltransferase family protein [Clostridia bacterium]
MNAKTNRILFLLLRSAICGAYLEKEDRALLTSENLDHLYAIAKEHDVEHLLALGLEKNGFKGSDVLKKSIFRAVWRAEQRERDLENVQTALSESKIAFIPLKGAVLCHDYPEAWMRTSCDIDVLVHGEDLALAVEALTALGYQEAERTGHDVSLFSPEGHHVEIHFDLVEEGRASNAISVLKSVWEHATPQKGTYCYEMSDAFFYFYHIAHMAKHFETGGCGIRPLIDLFILDRRNGADRGARDALLEQSGLLPFAAAARKLSCVWLGDAEPDDQALLMEAFILSGGVYGTTDNRVLAQQKKRGGKVGYLFSRIFVPYQRLKRLYPVLEKHKYLMPLMQVRRWFRLLNPKTAKMARRELRVNKRLDSGKAKTMEAFFKDLGL